MSRLPLLQDLVGRRVTAMTEVQTGRDWRRVFVAHGVLSAPYGEHHRTWDVGDNAVILLPVDADLHQEGPFTTARFGDCRVRIALGPPPPARSG